MSRWLLSAHCYKRSDIQRKSVLVYNILGAVQSCFSLVSETTDEGEKGTRYSLVLTLAWKGVGSVLSRVLYMFICTCPYSFDSTSMMID